MFLYRLQNDLTPFRCLRLGPGNVATCKLCLPAWGGLGSGHAAPFPLLLLLVLPSCGRERG